MSQVYLVKLTFSASFHEFAETQMRYQYCAQRRC